MKSVCMAGVKLWAPPSFVKFGCLVHDVQLSSSARRTCRMVALSSSQVALFVMSVAASDISMVSMICCSRRLHAGEHRPQETQTSSAFPALPSLSQSLPLPAALLARARSRTAASQLFHQAEQSPTVWECALYPASLQALAAVRTMQHWLQSASNVVRSP